MKQKLLISFSGGRTSAYMTWWLLRTRSNEYDIMVVFANTGKEREETLNFINNCDVHFGFNTIWVEGVTNPQRGKGMTAKVVTFATASRNGEPFEQVIAKYGIPNRNSPNCSRDLKERVINSFARSIGWKGYYTAIGIRSDEMDRINYERARKERLLYPLATVIPTRKEDVNAFWAKQSFDLQLKSYEGNCDLCWKKSLRKLMTLVKENPELAEWWREMELKYGYHDPKGKTTIDKPLTFFREGRSMNDIVSLSQSHFVPAEDEGKMLPQPNLFSDIDQSFGCEESCEAFN